MLPRQGLLPYISAKGELAEVCAQCGGPGTPKNPAVECQVDWLFSPESSRRPSAHVLRRGVVGVRARLHVECISIVRAWRSPKVLSCRQI